MANGNTNPLAAYSSEEQKAIAEQIRSLRASGKLNHAQMLSTGKFLISMQPKISEPKPAGIGTKARELTLGALGQFAPESPDSLPQLVSGVGGAIRHPIDTARSIGGAMKETEKRGLENIGAGKTGLGISQMAAGILPVGGPAMAKGFEEIETGIASKDPTMKSHGIGTALGGAAVAPAVAKSLIEAPRAIATAPGKALNVADRMGTFVKESGANIVNKYLKISAEDAKKVFDFEKDPGRATLHPKIKTFSTRFSVFQKKIENAANSIESLRKQAVAAGQRGKVTIDASSATQPVFDAIIKASNIPETAAGFLRKAQAVVSDLQSKNLTNLPFEEADELNNVLKNLGEYDRTAPPEIAKIVRQAKHNIVDAMDKALPGYAKLSKFEAELIDSQNLMHDKWLEWKRGADTSAMLKIPIFYRIHRMTLGLLEDAWNSTPSATGRAAVLNFMGDVLKSPKRFVQTLPSKIGRREQPGQAGMAAPSGPTAPMPQGQIQPGTPQAPSTGIGTPAQSAPVSATATIGRPTGQAAPPAQQSLQSTTISSPASASPSASADLMARANAVARNASTNDLGQFVNVKTGLEPRRLPQKTGTETVAVDAPSGRVVKAIFDSGKLTKVQVGRNTYRNPTSIAKALNAHKITEAELQSQIGKPAHASLHGTGTVGTRASAAERQAASRAKAIAERPVEPPVLGPDHLMIIIDEAKRAIAEVHGAKGRTIVDAFNKVSGVKKWSLDEQYENILQLAENLDRIKH